MTEELLTTSTVARKFECSESLVRKLAREGRLPSMRTDSGFRLFRRDDVERVLEERRAKAR